MARSVVIWGALLAVFLAGCETSTGRALNQSAKAAGEGKVFESAINLAVAPVGLAIDVMDVLFNGVDSDTGKALRSKDETPKKGREPPAIRLLAIAETSETVVEVKGTITSSGRIVSATINGGDLGIKEKGSFSVRRGLQIGDNPIRLTVTDEWGQTAEASTVAVRRVASGEERPAPLTPEGLRGTPRPKAIALIIGIDHYEGLPRAEFAENDARRFYDYATNALGVPSGRVKLLVGGEARLIAVRKALHSWLLPKIVPGETEVFVFFAGHGLASGNGSGTEMYLLPYDGDRDLLAGSSLRRREIIDQLMGAGAASTTLFLDTCFSGGTRGGDTLLAGARPVRLEVRNEETPPRVSIFSAAALDQLALTLPAAGHGLYSYQLMKGLEGGAGGPGRQITASSLQAFLATTVSEQAARHGSRQTPQLTGTDSGVIVQY